MDFEFVHSPFSLRVITTNFTYIHCCDGSLKRRGNQMFTLNRYIINLYDETNDIHITLPFCTIDIIDLIYQMIDNRVTISNPSTANKVVEIIKILGGIVEKNNSKLTVKTGFNPLSPLIAAKSPSCDLCNKLKELIVPTPFPIDICRCRSAISSSTEKETEIWKRAVGHLKFINPLATDSQNPCLNGLLTSRETNNLIDIDKVVIPQKAWINNDLKLAYIKALKNGKFPFLSIHNLSVILDQFPSLGKSPKDSHICIFCSEICSNRSQILYHVQRHHTGFAIKCDLCDTIKADEYLYIRHRINKHKERRSLGLTCSNLKYRQEPDAIQVGLTAYRSIITNKQRYGSKGTTHLTSSRTQN